MALFFCVKCASVSLHEVRCGRPAVFIWLCQLHTIEDHILCHAMVVSSTNLIKAEESRRLHVLQLYRIGESVQYIHHLLYLLNIAATHKISRRTAAGRLIALCAPTYNRGVVQHVVFDRFGLAQPHECSWQAATRHAYSAVQAAFNSV